MRQPFDNFDVGSLMGGNRSLSGVFLGAEVDRILEKIYRNGEASLTPQERQTLEKASREYQQRGVGNGGHGDRPNRGH